MLPVVNIGTTDPNRMHPQEDLIGTRFWDRTVLLWRNRNRQEGLRCLLPRDLVDALSLETLKAMLDRALSNRWSCGCPCSPQGVVLVDL